MVTNPLNCDGLIEKQLDEYAKILENKLDSDVLAFSGPLVGVADDFVRDFVELMQRPNHHNKLAVILATSGGYIEVVHRIVDTIRHHYGYIRFIVPSHAYSAGTILVMSGDAIFMDYYSRLGPIDPQVEIASGQVVPALGYLIQWERLLKKAADGTITEAEKDLMTNGFDQAELYKYEQERELSIALLEEWLVKYKFKNWVTTATHHRTVTLRMRRARAKRIAEELNNTEKWHVHGHGISMAVLRNDLNLLIDDFGTEAGLNGAIKQYYNLFDEYISTHDAQGALHIVGKYLPLWQEEPANGTS